MRVWFNRTFSSVHSAIGLIREADPDGSFHLIYSNANPHNMAARVAHQFHEEPTGLEAEAYRDWCLAFCREHRVDIFIPGKEASALAGGQLIDMRQDIIDATAELARAYGLNSVFNVQFREGAGKLRLLEINPRMSGGIGMACVAGPNLPYIALRGFADGFDQVHVPPVRNGIRVAELNMATELA